jgi:hypothetical protein
MVDAANRPQGGCRITVRLPLAPSSSRQQSVTRISPFQ